MEGQNATINCLKGLVGKFVWLQISPEFASPDKHYGYGYIAKVTDEGMIEFCAIGKDAKIKIRQLIHHSMILGMSWSGEQLDKVRIWANSVNFISKRDEKEVLDQYDANQMGSDFFTTSQQQVNAD